MSETKEPRPLLSIDDAARLTGTSERTIRALISSRKIPYTKIGRYVRFRPEDLEAYVQANTREAR